MFRRNSVLAVLLGITAFALTGCMPHMTLDEMKAQMPQRPAELDRLNAFVGKWQGEAEGRFAMLDEPVKMTGTSEAKWDGDRWFVVSRGVMRMADFPETQGMELWTYDVGAKKYRSYFVDSIGMSGMSEARYDEKTNTWHMTSDSYGAWGKSRYTGTLKFTDPDTMEWSMTENMGLMKVMEMKGTSRRVK